MQNPRTPSALPAYLSKQADGIFVDLAIFPVSDGFQKDIDKLFSSGVRFVGLDYNLLMGLLYNYGNVMDVHGMNVKVRLAKDIVVFSPKRRELYKGVKIDALCQHAIYIFEPVSIEVNFEEPIYSEPDAEGVTHVVGVTKKQEFRPARLDLDEFIADMWCKGVRYGIKVDAVSAMIAKGGTGRMEIATYLGATKGSDAEIVEACSELHRDNSPKMMDDGKVDLRKFQNRFPQIASGVRLLKKKPRVLGKPGYEIGGQSIEPVLPNDHINLQAMAGDGTHVEILEDGEYIVADRDGFLSLDVGSNNIAVTEKIENRGGISLKTTGDLALVGDEFIEHGEVQEGRVVEGKSMTFRSSVYGDVVSSGGTILFEGNLSGGSAICQGGDIIVKKRVFNSQIKSIGGGIKLNYAESSLIMGASVQIEHAVNCEIVAENVEIAKAEGCGIAGKQVQVVSSGSCRTNDSVISILLPDLTELDQKIALISQAMDEGNTLIKARDHELALLKSDAEFARFLTLASSIRQKKIQLNETQQEGWKKMTARFAKHITTSGRLSAEKQEQLKLVQSLLQEKGPLMLARAEKRSGIRCEIMQVVGETVVQSVVADLVAIQAGNIKGIRANLRDQGKNNTRIFSGEHGSVHWIYEEAPVADNV